MLDSSVDEALKLELERMRARLLDLSARTPLLNYSHPRAKSLRIVDEVPALVLTSLVTNGGFRFSPLESPDAPERPQDRARRTWGHAAAGVRQLGILEDATTTADDSDEGLVSLSDRERRDAAKAARAKRESQIQIIARDQGINPSYDLLAAGESDASQHADKRLQTLLTPDELEERLQKLPEQAGALEPNWRNVKREVGGVEPVQDENQAVVFKEPQIAAVNLK